MTILDLYRIIATKPGFKPFSGLWRATLAFFYGLALTAEDVQFLTRATRRTETAIRARAEQGSFTELWCRIGRRGWKSASAALIGIFEACYGGHEHYLLRGELGLIAIVSKDTAGSTVVARFCELFAEALGIRCAWSSMGAVRILTLEGFAFAIACFPCSAKSPRGYPIAVVIIDEPAHWPTETDEYVNTDSAVLGAIRPAMAQFASPKLIAISSPLGCDGIFHETVEANLGDDATPSVLAVEGPSWLWGDVTEAKTRDIEKDPETHAREFGAIPSQTEGTA